MKLSVIPVVVGALGMISKGLKKKRRQELEIIGIIEILQTTELLKSEFREESWRPEAICCHSDSSEGITS